MILFHKKPKNAENSPLSFFFCRKMINFVSQNRKIFIQINK